MSTSLKEGRQEDSIVVAHRRSVSIFSAYAIGDKEWLRTIKQVGCSVTALETMGQFLVLRRAKRWNQPREAPALTRPIFSQLWGFKIRRTTFLDLIKCVHLLIAGLKNCRRAGRGVLFFTYKMSSL